MEGKRCCTFWFSVGGGGVEGDVLPTRGLGSNSRQHDLVFLTGLKHKMIKNFVICQYSRPYSSNHFSAFFKDFIMELFFVIHCLLFTDFSFLIHRRENYHENVTYFHSPSWQYCLVPHSLKAVLFPTHWFPPFSGFGFVHSLVLVCMPLIFLVHVLHLLHSLQPPWTEK